MYKSYASIENQMKDVTNMKHNVKSRRSGFTLGELLIVLAIIGVLVAISIPIFTNQLEKSREAVDLANVRAAYAKVMSEATLSENVESVTVELTQKKDDFQTEGDISIGGITKANEQQWRGKYPHAGGSANVSYDSRYGVVINWSGRTVIATVGTKSGYWNGETGKIALSTDSISTYNSDRTDGRYELESGKTYTISCTYSAEWENNRGLLASAILLYNESNQCIMDTGSTKLLTQETELKNGKSNQENCGSYQYKKNKDGTYTYTATFTAPEATSEGGKCYLAMNFFGRNLNSASGSQSLSNFMNEEQIKNVQKQIQQSFTVEETSR